MISYRGSVQRYAQFANSPWPCWHMLVPQRRSGRAFSHYGWTHCIRLRSTRVLGICLLSWWRVNCTLYSACGFTHQLARLMEMLYALQRLKDRAVRTRSAFQRGVAGMAYDPLTAPCFHPMTNEMYCEHQQLVLQLELYKSYDCLYELPSARLTSHFTKLSTYINNVRKKKKFLVLRFLVLRCISQNLKATRLQGCTQTELWTCWRNFDPSRSFERFLGLVHGFAVLQQMV
jgi:hypothetical protein